MLSPRDVQRDLADVAIELRGGELEALLDRKLSDRAHGRLPEWRRSLDQLPDIRADEVLLDRDAVTATAVHIDSDHQRLLRRLLLDLLPWRKGPFELFGVGIDAEWRSNLKWDRLQQSITPLAGRTVLDVGCGNGYYAYRMQGLGARLVLGIDPTLNHLVQFCAVQRYLGQPSLHILPLRLEELPLSAGAFDTTFSMGVLYHQRLPKEHLLGLAGTLRPGGELVLETLVVPGTEPQCMVPEKRYARMRNVWALPTVPELERWLEDTGFDNCRTLDISITDTHEQRPTEWMPYESLAHALDPHDSALTVEGLPRPRRALLLSTKS